MLKKALFSLMLCISANSYCVDINIAKIVNDDMMQSFAIGLASAYFRPLIIESLRNQPVRAGAITCMIFLAHCLNIFRKNEDRMRRFIATLFGAATLTFIRNK